MTSANYCLLAESVPSSTQIVKKNFKKSSTFFFFFAGSTFQQQQSNFSVLVLHFLATSKLLFYLKFHLLTRFVIEEMLESF